MPASHPLRSTSGESAQNPQATSPAAPAKLGLLRSCVGMKDQPALRFSLRCEAGRRFCCRCGRQHILCVRSLLPASGWPSARTTFILIALAPPAGGTLQRGIKSRTIWRCLSYRCFPVTLTASRRENTPRRHTPALVAWQSSRQIAGILPANAAASPSWSLGRGGYPKSPRPFPMLDPFHPQEVFAPIGIGLARCAR